VNKLRFSRASLSLLAPLLIFSALCLGPASCGGNSGGGSPASSPTAALVQVGFVTNLSGIAPASLRSFILNVTGVRMNPLPNSKNTATPSETSGKWVIIPVPTATATGASPGSYQLDVLAGQSQMQVFNSFGVKNGKFTTIEVVLDTTSPGGIVPLCAGGSLEGCIQYPLQLQNAGTPITFQESTPIETEQHKTVQLPILLSANVVSTPSGPGQPYVVSVSASAPADNASGFVATVTGKVSGASGSIGGARSHLRVTAELGGTNTIVASTEVFSDGTYTLFLPAAAGVGTLYDFYVSGGSTTIQATRGVSGARVFPNTTSTVDFEVKGGQTIGGFSGQITDACTHQPISGATVQILVPQSGDETTDCTVTPQNCVTVATAETDDVGNYPLPGTIVSPPPIVHLPIGSPSPTPYVLMISAPGYDSTLSQGTAAQNAASGGTAGGHCPPSAGNGTCNFSLTTGYIQGSVNLTAAQPPGFKTTVQVFAENFGTNQLVSTLPAPLTILGGQTGLGFTLNVPTHAFNSSAAQNFDIFAEAEDQFQGGPAPFPGHTILAQSNVAGPPTACATVASGLFAQAMDCTGHGSISGTAGNNPAPPDAGTTVQLFKNNVALAESAVGPPTPAPSVGNSYNFCVPPDDSYTLQRFETGSPVATPAAVGAMATPVATSTPCPSTCFSSGGGCPGTCSNTAGPTM